MIDQKPFFKMILQRSIQFFLIVSLSMPLVGCSLWRKMVTEEKLPVYTQRKLPGDGQIKSDDGYVEALEAFQKKDYEKAIELFEKFTIDRPTSKFTMASFYYLGVSYSELMVWSMAIKNFRFVVTHKAASRELVAQSLYRLSFCYEAINQPTKTIATLLETQARHRDLPFEIANAEVPARLAAAYARIGNESEALRFYAKAESGIEKLRRQKPERLETWLPKTLFYMGTINDLQVSYKSFGFEIHPLKKAQGYLLQAAEFKDQDWSDRSVKRLQIVYEAFWKAIQTLPAPQSPDRLLAAKERQEQQWEMTRSLLGAVDELQKGRLPDGNEGEYVAKIFDFLEGYEEKLRQFLESDPVGQGLTPEAEQREGLYRGGQTQGSETILEKNLSNEKPLPKKNSDQDPNL